MHRYIIRLHDGSLQLGEDVEIVLDKPNQFESVAVIATFKLFAESAADNVSVRQCDPTTGEPFADYFFYAEKV